MWGRDVLCGEFVDAQSAYVRARGTGRRRLSPPELQGEKFSTRVCSKVSHSNDLIPHGSHGSDASNTHIPVERNKASQAVNNDYYGLIFLHIPLTLQED